MKKFAFIVLAIGLSLFLYHEKTFSPTFKFQTEVVRTEEEIGNRSPSKILDVPVIRQLPELYNGCEVTSLSMLLAFAGQPVNKLELADRIKKDSTPFKGTGKSAISQWGDPNEGFVGDITGKKKGYGVYNGPLYELLQSYVRDRAVNLTGEDFSLVEWAIDKGRPVVAWTTVRFQPSNEWVTWKKGDQTIKATFQEHAVLLVGYDDRYIYVNDPLTGAKGQKVEKQSFLASWKQLGSQAVTVVEQDHWYALAEITK